MAAPWAFTKELLDISARGYFGGDMQFALERTLYYFLRWSRLPILENTGLAITVDKRNGKTGCEARRVLGDATSR